MTGAELKRKNRWIRAWVYAPSRIGHFWLPCCKRKTQLSIFIDSCFDRSVRLFWFFFSIAGPQLNQGVMNNWYCLVFFFSLIYICLFPLFIRFVSFCSRTSCKTRFQGLLFFFLPCLMSPSWSSELLPLCNGFDSPSNARKRKDWVAIRSTSQQTRRDRIIKKKKKKTTYTYISRFPWSKNGKLAFTESEGCHHVA